MNNNEFNNIEIPKEIDLFIKNGLNKAIIDKKRRKNKIAKMAISASIMGAIFTGFSLNVIAQRMPFLNNVFEELKNNKSSETMSISFNEYIDKYSQPINQTVTSNGITVTAEKVVCDGSNLYVSYIIKKDTKFDEDQLSTNIIISDRNTVDFKKNSNLWSKGSLEGAFVDDYTFVGIQTIFLDYLTDEIPDEFMMNTSFDYIEPVKSNEWNFEFPVKVNRDANYKIDVNKTSDAYTTHAVNKNAFSLDVEYTIPKDKEKDKRGITTFYSIVLYDDKGDFLTLLQDDYLYDEDQDKERRLAKFEPIDDKCKYIEIVYTERNYIDDEKNPGSYKEYENGELNDIKIKVPIN